jgi:hypothetical protein
LDAPEFKDLEQVDYYFQDGLYKYTVGNVMTLEDAAVIQDQCRWQALRMPLWWPFTTTSG